MRVNACSKSHSQSNDLATIRQIPLGALESWCLSSGLAQRPQGSYADHFKFYHPVRRGLTIRSRHSQLLSRYPGLRIFMGTLYRSIPGLRDPLTLSELILSAALNL